jgi:hypothetical protein
LTVRESFAEVLKNLDAAFFLHASARLGRNVILSDFSYVNSSKSGVVPPGIPAEGSLRQTSFTLLAGVSVVEQASNTVDVVGGFRTWWVKASVKSPALPADVSPERNFSDFLIGARGTFRAGERWTLVAYGDLGLFRLGSRSTYQLMGTALYHVNPSFSISAGYRYLDVDYRSGGVIVDVALSGPLLGATWRF